MTAALYLGPAVVVLLTYVAWPFLDADTLGVAGPTTTQPWPEPVHERDWDVIAHPSRHAFPAEAPDTGHRPQHTGELPALWGDRYRQHNAAVASRATGRWMEDTADLSRYRTAAITAEYEVVEPPLMGQGPFIVATPVPEMPRWFSDDRMAVR